MQDLRMQRIHRQLGSSLTVLNAAAVEAEALRDQALAEDLHEHLHALKMIYAGISSRGQAYRRPSTTVRN